MSFFLDIPVPSPPLDELHKIILAQEEQERCSLKEQIENMMKEKNMISNTFHNSDEEPPPLYRCARNAFMEESAHKRVINNKGDYAHFNANGSGYFINWGIYHAQNDMIIFYYTDQHHELNIQQYAPTLYVYYIQYDKVGEYIEYKNDSNINIPIDWYTGEEKSDTF